MTTEEIIQEFVRIKKEDPERFYNAMGYGDDGVNIMNSFVSGSYELGLIAGARYALDYFASQRSASAKDEEMLGKVLDSICSDEYITDREMKRRCRWVEELYYEKKLRAGGGHNPSRELLRDHAPTLACAKGKI